MTLLPDGELYIDVVLRDAAGDAKNQVIGPWSAKIVGFAADGSTDDMEETMADEAAGVVGAIIP